MLLTRRSALGVLASAPTLAIGPKSLGYAQDGAAYPAKEIHAPCGFPPGSANDLIVRYFAEQLSKLAGKPVVVENRPGAFGNIATEAVAKAKPDGLTIYISGGSTFAAAPFVFKKLSYSPLKDFDFVTTLGALSFVLLVDTKLPIHSVAELTAHLKSKDGKGAYASATLPSLVASELYLKSIGVKASAVNYRTTADSMNDLLSGSIDFTFASASFATAQVGSGKLRALGITAPQRMAATPDWPTMVEEGIPGYNFVEFWLVSVPSGTPTPIIEKLGKWYRQIVLSSDTAKFLKNVGMDPLTESQTTVRKMVEDHTSAWKEYAVLAKIEPM